MPGRSWILLTILAVPIGCERRAQPTQAPPAQQPPADPVLVGEAYHRIKGCNACHSVNGTPGVGPPLDHYWGTERALSDGRVVVADDNYFRRSLFDPAADIVAGYPNQMQPFTGQLTVEVTDALAAYYKSLSPAAADPFKAGRGKR